MQIIINAAMVSVRDFFEINLTELILTQILIFDGLFYELADY